MQTTYTIPTNTDYWGAECTPEKALEMAHELKAHLQQRFPAVEFRLVPERQSWNNRATGDEELIEEIKRAEESIILDL